MDISKAIKKGVVITFESLEALSSHYGLPLAHVLETLETYNEAVIQGCDQVFAKKIVDGSKPIQKAPFYGMRLWPKVHYTMGGLSINGKAQVLNLDGEVIVGLYAAGEITGGIHGASRLGSCAITDCLVFGRIAGQHI